MAKPSRPAFDLVADKPTLRRIGELCVIFGQIELSMRHCVIGLLDVPEPLARRILGSSKLADNALLWIEIMRSRCEDKGLLAVAEDAYKLFQPLTQGRNDFIHAVFVYQTHGAHRFMAPVGYKPFPDDRPIAVRLRDPTKTAELANLKTVRDAAARLSRMLAHIEYSLGNDDGRSPWRGKF